MRALPALMAVALFTAPAVAQERDAPGVTIDALHQAAREADGAAYFDLFTPEAAFIGTDASERWSLAEFRAYAEPYFAQGRGWDYRVRSRTVTVAPIDCRCIAWFEELLDHQTYGTARGSGVLRLTDDGWRIEQYVLSFPVPNDVAREVTARIREHEAARP